MNTEQRMEFPFKLLFPTTYFLMFVQFYGELW